MPSPGAPNAQQAPSDPVPGWSDADSEWPDDDVFSLPAGSARTHRQPAPDPLNSAPPRSASNQRPARSSRAAARARADHAGLTQRQRLWDNAVLLMGQLIVLGYPVPPKPKRCAASWWACSKTVSIASGRCRGGAPQRGQGGAASGPQPHSRWCGEWWLLGHLVGLLFLNRWWVRRWELAWVLPPAP